ncbi:MAG: hypothetical protein Q4A74_08680 [Cardiobacteriaceae bacterium]|nr:hypothetical protein [Cardiobacteriaceae bacterium]
MEEQQKSEKRNNSIKPLLVVIIFLLTGILCILAYTQIKEHNIKMREQRKQELERLVIKSRQEFLEERAGLNKERKMEKQESNDSDK